MALGKREKSICVFGHVFQKAFLGGGGQAFISLVSMSNAFL